MALRERPEHTADEAATATERTARRREITRREARPWPGVEAAGFRPVLDLIGDASLVLLGEATHGTQEFYAARAALTRALIESGRCHAVMVEADWPDANRVDRYVRHRALRDGPVDADAASALAGFERFPRWMWRNREVVAFIEWLRAFNAERPPPERVGFHGLDLYSLYSSIGGVIEYLERVDPEAARQARSRYACFEHFDDDPQAYGAAAEGGNDCEEEAVAQLVQLAMHRGEYLARDGVLAADEQFVAEMNARLVRNAERYYRTLFSGGVNTWNLRDRHMAEILGEFLQHLGRRQRVPRVAIWAHNSHLGDARATSMAERDELNLGQLVRETYAGRSFHLGFTTYSGTVAAASDWGQTVQLRRVRPALPGSVEAELHAAAAGDFLLNLRDPQVAEAWRDSRLERAIGVVYRPESERESHYFHVRLSEQFDAIVHVDESHAVEPLDYEEPWQVPEEEEAATFPSGL